MASYFLQLVYQQQQHHICMKQHIDFVIILRMKKSHIFKIHYLWGLLLDGALQIEQCVIILIRSGITRWLDWPDQWSLVEFLCGQGGRNQKSHPKISINFLSSHNKILIWGRYINCIFLILCRNIKPSTYFFEFLMVTYHDFI